MVGKTHIAVGVTLCTAISGLNPAGMAVAAIASKLPDIDLAFKHRGPVHSLLVAGLVLLGTSRYFPNLVFPVAAGYLSHIFLDALTPAGVSLFWPFYKKRVGVSAVYTGGIGDSFCRWTALVFLVFLLARKAAETIL
ncbi:MAG: hypothetical protein AVO34_06810 [Firmicutes bacterium ML8_F2]|jgi:inner membrane protein|nr:MAG: hypothetical protein AVO34_06810 [Firmicutes bacterium ML8_F2]